MRKAMIRHCLALVFLLFAVPGLPAQRGGRPDAAQNYGRVQNPQLLLQVRVQKKRIYFHASDLRKMQRSTVTLTDPITNASHTYEGVAIEDLAPHTAFVPERGTLEISSDPHLKTTILTADLDPAAKPMVADTVDGRKLTGSVPYYFIAKYRQGTSQSIKNVTCISLNSSP